MVDFRAEVIIVGAGIAGLTLARRLQEQSIPALILEQNSRPSGRIEASRRHTSCELGAEFIHGHPKEIHSLIAEAHLEVEDYLMDGGEGRLFRLGNALYNQGSAFAREVEYEYELLHTHTGQDMSVEELAQKVKVKESGPGFFARGRVVRLEGTELKNISARSLALAMKNVGNADRNYRIRGGFQRLIGWLKEHAPVVYGAKVTQVFWDGSDIVLITSDNLRFMCKKIVITIPIDAPGRSRSSSSIATMTSVTRSACFRKCSPIDWFFSLHRVRA